MGAFNVHFICLLLITFFRCSFLLLEVVRVGRLISFSNNSNCNSNSSGKSGRINTA